MPGDDFVDTAIMMHEAGSVLVSDQPRSACYLLGYVAECTLKAAALVALVQRGKSSDEARTELKFSVSHDLGRLETLHRLLALSPSARIRPLAPLSRLAPRMSMSVIDTGGGSRTEHWNPNHRYDGSRWDAQAAQDYQAEADRLLQILGGLRLDGAL